MDQYSKHAVSLGFDIDFLIRNNCSHSIFFSSHCWRVRPASGKITVRSLSPTYFEDSLYTHFRFTTPAYIKQMGHNHTMCDCKQDMYIQNTIHLQEKEVYNIEMESWKAP